MLKFCFMREGTQESPYVYIYIMYIYIIYIYIYVHTHICVCVCASVRSCVCIGKTSPRRPAEQLRGKDKNSVKGAELPPDASLNEIFMKFAAGDGQSKKRAAAMDGKEFIALLEYLKLHPAKVNKTQVMDIYAKGKANSGGDKSEMDWDGFEFAMKKIADAVGVSYGLLHTLAQSGAPQITDQSGASRSPRKEKGDAGVGMEKTKLQEAGTKVSNVLKLSLGTVTAREPKSADQTGLSQSSRGDSRSPRKLQEAGTKVSNALKLTQRSEPKSAVQKPYGASPKTTPRGDSPRKLQEAGIKVSNALKLSPGKKP
jgi:hypothetical protein